MTNPQQPEREERPWYLTACLCDPALQLTDYAKSHFGVHHVLACPMFDESYQESRRATARRRQRRLDNPTPTI